MFTIPNQSSIPKAYTQFTDETIIDQGEAAVEDRNGDGRGTKAQRVVGGGGNRLKPSANRDRVVDCMEEFVKYTILMRPHFALFGDRYSERLERKAKEEAAVKNGLVNGVLE